MSAIILYRGASSTRGASISRLGRQAMPMAQNDLAAVSSIVILVGQR
jgi:hypothetical protein